MDNQIKVFIDQVFLQAKEAGFSEYEIVYQSDISTSVSVREGKVVQYENSDISSISFRGLYGSQMGYSSTEDFSLDQIPFLIEQAKDNCKILELKEKVTVYEGDPEYPEYNGYSEEIANMGYQELADMALKFERKLLDYDPRIIAVDECATCYSCGELLMMNSKGLSCSSLDNAFASMIYCRVKDGDDVQTYGKSWAFKKRSEFDIDACVKFVGDHALARIGAAPIPSKKTKIVLDKDAARSLLVSFAKSFSAEAMQKGLSRLTGKLGEQIANEKITIIDEGMIGDSYLNIPFDGEGVCSKRTVVVDHGVFVSPLHNRKTALVDGVQSTGNATRSGGSSLGISPMNFYIEKGNTSLNDLLKQLGNGVYITDVAGLHAGINAVSGDFSLMAEGFVVEDGQVGQPINQITIADNFFDILQKIEVLGDDVNYFDLDASHIQSPSLLIPDVAVSGT